MSYKVFLRFGVTMPLFPFNPFEFVVGTLFFEACARLVCGQPVLFKFGVTSDGDEGPDDGANHVHPEKVFHFDLHPNPFSVLLCG